MCPRTKLRILTLIRGAWPCEAAGMARMAQVIKSTCVYSLAAWHIRHSPEYNLRMYAHQREADHKQGTMLENIMTWLVAYTFLPFAQHGACC